MLKDKLQNFLIKKGNEPNKKKIENLVVLVIILIITIIVINVILNGDKDSNDNIKTDSNKKLAQTLSNENKEEIGGTSKDNLTVNLEEILSKINGVGEVKVMLTYSETSKTVPIYNEESVQETTEEKDSRGRNKESYTNR